ncbi:MAG TPA: phosphate acyltransferase PlsX [Longimicrobiales bacterium]|nr:phosphate acyltransferase PlsX [Longimicrobiales bacterium]
MRIALDAMGTDLAPEPEVLGALQALEQLEPDIEIVLVGDEPVVSTVLEKHGGPRDRLSIHHAPDRVTASDAPASVIRKKPDSSIVVGLKLHKEGAVQAFVSAGSTGAMMATSLFTLKPLPGVDRPSVATPLPTVSGPCLLIDSGANVDCKPHQLVQFAHLGSSYARDTMGLEKPRVALLNIGEEPEKGNEVVTETHALLAKEPGVHFIGNIEGRDIILGATDVAVCDGFVGNVLLKFYESVAGFIISLLEPHLAEAREKSADLQNVFRILDYAEYGGAPLLGVGGVSIICHGESPPKAIHNALAVAARAVRSDMVKHSARDVSAGARLSGTGSAMEVS